MCEFSFHFRVSLQIVLSIICIINLPSKIGREINNHKPSRVLYTQIHRK